MIGESRPEDQSDCSESSGLQLWSRVRKYTLARP